MSIVIDIESPKVRKIRDITGAESDIEAIEAALDRFVMDYEAKPPENGKSELPDAFWDELFSQPQLPRGTTIKAVLDDRDEARY